MCFLPSFILAFNLYYFPSFQLVFSTNRELRLKSDCAFFFNPLFDEEVVVRNAMLDGKWGTEERDGGFPFEKEVMFEIHFKVTNLEYQVSTRSVFIHCQRDRWLKK